MKIHSLLSLLAFGLTATSLQAVDQYWDLNGATAGSGGATPIGTWDTSTANWSPDPLGTRPVTIWGNGNTAVFSAGSDATGLFTVTVAAVGAGGIRIEEGSVQLTGGNVSMAAGTITLNSGTVLTLDSKTRVTTSGGILTLNGGMLRQTDPTSGVFISGLSSITIGAAGGTLDTSTGAGIQSTFTGTITGAGNTLTKTGAGEFRYFGANFSGTTYAKLVVNQGLFSLGNTANNSEVGFGAAPASFTADAITLAGGGQIGVNFTNAPTLNANRGITLGAGGGGFAMSGGAMSVAGVISGSGGLTVTGGTQPLNLLGVNTFTGGFTMNGGGNVNVGSTGRLSGVGPVTITSGTLSLSNAATTITALSGAGNLTFRNGHVLTVDNTSATIFGGVIAGTGGLIKNGVETLTLAGGSANTFSGSIRINDGKIIAGKASALGSGNALILAGGTFDTGGFNQAMGTLDLDAISTLDLGAGTSALTFANSSALDWGGFTLHILNWTVGSDALRFGVDNAGLTGVQLSEIFFDNFGEGAKMNSSGFVLPISVPEASPLALFGLGLLMLAAGRRLFWRCA